MSRQTDDSTTWLVLVLLALCLADACADISKLNRRVAAIEDVVLVEGGTCE